MAMKITSFIKKFQKKLWPLTKFFGIRAIKLNQNSSLTCVFLFRPRRPPPPPPVDVVFVVVLPVVLFVAVDVGGVALVLALLTPGPRPFGAD
ncbi:hypothetical protein DERF_009546 [Dermatophagoides farinae]|uniref:Transmembrane protein n=1 Tax=Dermatophagoides farinae TaxID=6954 RepID=A0A922HV71_DERFA|nr:hypothetical protein DERF_009546 [Dermatophagoides farinae]